MGLRGIGGRDLRLNAPETGRKRKSWMIAGLSRAERVIRFIQHLKLSTGEHAGKKFRLREWQKDIIKRIYEIDAEGKRIKRQILISIPRKNGKSQLAAALALAHLVGPESEPRGQVYSAAADRKQAALIFAEMCAFIRADDALSARVVIRSHNKSLEDLESGSIYEALSSDARKSHGLNASFVVCDEVAQWSGRDLWDGLASGSGARSEPLMVAISTKSPDEESIMSELVRYGERVLAGEIVDDSFGAIIYAAQPGDDWLDEEVWHRCNPALGDFRSLDEFRVAAAQAKAVPGRQAAFRLLYLNQPTDVASAFVARADWEACRSDLRGEALAGERCYLGIDLSSTTDLTSVAAYFPTSGALLSWSWLPADGLAEAQKRDHAPYQEWVRQGVLEATPGRSVDKSFIAHRIGTIVATYDVQGAFADRWRLDELERLLADEGIKLKLTPHGQGWKDMAPSIDAFETAVLQRRLRHDGNPVFRMSLANATVMSDPAGNRKLVKSRSYGRIDPVVAAVMAVGGASRTPAKRPSVYQVRGLRVVAAG